DVTKPPLIAWTALKLYATSGNRDFLHEIYEPLCRLNRWWFEKNDDDRDGIVQYNHGFSSGLDDSPLWDEGMPVESPELNTYLVMQMDALAQIADILGLADDATQWRARAEELTQKIITHFWDEDAGVFWATHNHQPIRVLTPFNLYPLLTGRMPRAICDRLVAHLTNPNEFWTAYPIPTVARNDPKCDPNKMWRGPTWVNINYLFVEGLMRAGYPDLARELRAKTLELLMRHNDIYEYYNPDTGDPPPHAASVFGWSSAVFVDLAIQASRSQDPKSFP
ncbi:partial Glucosidase YgjK, partial [Anaerolineae bacterium]